MRKPQKPPVSEVEVTIRMQEELRDRADAVGALVGPTDTVDRSKMARLMLTVFVECSEALGRRPFNLLEFAEWLAKREKKKK